MLSVPCTLHPAPCTLLLPPSRQLMAAYAEEGATSDAIYFLGKALGDNVVGCEAYLKQVIVTLWVYKAFTKPPPDLQTSYMTWGVWQLDGVAPMTADPPQ